MFHNRARTDSAPSRGTTPQGKGREGIRKGRERIATAMSLVVVSGEACIASTGSKRAPRPASRCLPVRHAMQKQATR